MDGHSSVLYTSCRLATQKNLRLSQTQPTYIECQLVNSDFCAGKSHSRVKELHTQDFITFHCCTNIIILIQ
jgi:hypothetical protein